MGSASASGENRSEIAISKALDSPLLNDNKITGAKNVLLLIVSGSEEITIDEIGEINDYIQAEAKSNVNIIMGVGEDESLGNAISVTIVATGFNKDQQHEISNTEAKKIIHTLNDDQEATFDFTEKRIIKEPSMTQNNKPDFNMPAPMRTIEDKIIFDLGDEIEDDFEIISTTEFIKNIEVVHEEIAFQTDNDFIITSFVPEKEEDVLKVEEEKQISFTFDLPISEFKNKTQVEEPKMNIDDIDVHDHQQVNSIKKVDEDIYFTLEDYTELEESLTKASKPMVIEEKSNDEMNFTLRSKAEIDVKEYEVIDHKEVSPLDLTIAELQQRAADRREKMKNFNYKFINKLNKNIEEIEKEPAYKRMGVELDQTSHSSEFYQSRTTLEIDDTDTIQFRSNNSFLHDNVD